MQIRNSTPKLHKIMIVTKVFIRNIAAINIIKGQGNVNFANYPKNVKDDLKDLVKEISNTTSVKASLTKTCVVNTDKKFSFTKDTKRLIFDFIVVSKLKSSKRNLI